MSSSVHKISAEVIISLFSVYFSKGRFSPHSCLNIPLYLSLGEKKEDQWRRDGEVFPWEEKKLFSTSEKVDKEFEISLQQFPVEIGNFYNFYITFINFLSQEKMLLISARLLELLEEP